MVWALTGWLPHHLTFWSTAGSTRTSIFRRQPLDMMLSMCTQLLWSTMARPVLSGTCPVKLLCGLLGHHAAAQFQDVGNLLIAEAIFTWSNNSFFSDPQRVLCHEVQCWTSSDQYERVWELNTKLNTPAPHLHLRPCNTKESHDTGKGKWLVGPNLDVFTCTHFSCQWFRH